MTQDQIWQKAKEMGAQISADYEGEELILIGTLKGAIMWMADIMKNLCLDTQIDFYLSQQLRQRNHQFRQSQKIKKDIELDITGKNVLIIEDIIDTGNTLKYLRDYFLSQDPKSVRICTLLDKPSRRTADVRADYIGFTVDDLFIIGYGLDFDKKIQKSPIYQLFGQLKTFIIF